MVIFAIQPAQCTLLFPVVTVMDPWQTVISISNPGYVEDPVDGGLEFTFYRQAFEGMNFEPVTYTTGPLTPGSGLEVDGTLAAGSTYQAYIRDILAAAEWGETFVGHVHVRADYTGCTGLGWVTDFELKSTKPILRWCSIPTQVKVQTNNNQDVQPVNSLYSSPSKDTPRGLFAFLHSVRAAL